jgi:hypothetical protein
VRTANRVYRLRRFLACLEVHSLRDISDRLRAQAALNDGSYDQLDQLAVSRQLLFLIFLGCNSGTTTNQASTKEDTYSDIPLDALCSRYPSALAMTLNRLQSYPCGPLGPTRSALGLTGVGIAAAASKQNDGEGSQNE